MNQSGNGSVVIGWSGSDGGHANCIGLGSGVACSAANQLALFSSASPGTISSTFTNGGGANLTAPSNFLPVLINGVAYKIPLFNT